MRIFKIIVIAVGFICTGVAAAPKANDRAIGSDPATLRGGVVSDPLWDLEVPRQELEAVVMRFVQAFDGGNIDRLMALVGTQVRTEKGVRRAQEVRDEYVETFLGSSTRRLILRNVHWSHATDGVVADADFVLRVVSKRDDRTHERSGALRMHLNRQNTQWIIGELYFSDDN